MNSKFDELTKEMAQSVTRRQALKKFSFGIVGMALACFGLANGATAACLPAGYFCRNSKDCCSKKCVRSRYFGNSVCAT